MLFRLSLGSTPAKTGVTKRPEKPIVNIPRRARPHHRAFGEWLDANGARFKHKIQLHKTLGRWADFSFTGIHPAISGGLTEDGLCVSAKYQGDCWDLLYDDDAYPKKVPGGYVCQDCLPGYQKLFVSRAALWHDHLFEKLLAWANDELAHANWLVLQSIPGECSYAVLTGTKPALESAPGGDTENRWTTIAIPLR